MNWNGLEIPDNPFYCEDAVVIYCGDCRAILPQLPQDSVDLVLTDPPYGIGFMGKDWDKALPDKEVWQECLRILKPGAFAFAMCIPRADCLSRMIISLEDAGFWVNFTPIFWVYASGFPKAQNIGKLVDKRNGRTQETYELFASYLKSQRVTKDLSMAQIDELLGTNTAYSWWEGRLSGIQLPTKHHYLQLKEILDLDNRFDELIEREEAEREIIGKHPSPAGSKGNTFPLGQECDLTLPTTPQAKALDGSYGGFQPKPAVEVIIVAMKPLSEKTFVDQALKNGKGITWLDDGRIPYQGKEDIGNPKRFQETDGGTFLASDPANTEVRLKGGRFPANLLVSDDVLNGGENFRSAGSLSKTTRKYSRENSTYNLGQASTWYGDSGSFSRYFDLDKWFEERIKQLPKSVQRTFPFLIVPKASKSEKNKGCDDIEPQTKPLMGEFKGNPGRTTPKSSPTARSNSHPTVKPLKLMSYLITLGSREGDIVVDPYMGSGTSAVACQKLNRKFVGIDIKASYCEIAIRRCSQGVLITA